MEHDPEAIIKGFSEKLRSDWIQHRRQAFNSNTKGASYENALRNFLDDYFAGVYNIRTRVAVIDENMACFETFSTGENEFDVVSSFKQAIPEIILESRPQLNLRYRITFPIEAFNNQKSPHNDNKIKFL